MCLFKRRKNKFIETQPQQIEDSVPETAQKQEMAKAQIDALLKDPCDEEVFQFENFSTKEQNFLDCVVDDDDDN